MIPRVAITDSNPILRLSLSDQVAKDERFCVVGMAASGSELLALIREQPIDVAVVGWSLPDIAGGELISEIKRRSATIRVVTYASANVFVEAMKSGASGFVPDSHELAEVVEVVARVANGESCLTSLGPESPSAKSIRELTMREYELLTALASGATNVQIARQFAISRNTVKYHLRNVYEKLNVRNRAGAIAVLGSLRRRNRGVQ